MVLLLTTKLRSKLLTYFFTHPDETYYVRELASLIEEDAGNLSRELRRFEDEGICKSSTKGRVKFYSLNKHYSLFDEIKKIVFKTEGVEGALRQIVSAYKGMEIAFIYGSFAKDKGKKMSDIDLLVVGTFSRDDFTRRIRTLESKLAREINFTVYTTDEFEKERAKEGGFLNMVLKDKIILLKGSLA